tara:strand:- start:590 stop:1363 length:774 start_codon:yes stop_codon:yes gene_type:complete
LARALGLRAASRAGGFDAAAFGTLISWASASQGTYTDGASVVTLADESGNSNIFTAPAGSNEAVFVAGDPSYDFDGNDHYRGSSKTPFDTLHQTPQGAIVVRFALDDVTTNTIHALFSTCLFLSANVGIVLVVQRAAIFGAPRVRLAVYEGTGTAIYNTNSSSSNLAIANGEFVTVGVAWDATDARIYVNGSLVTTVAGSGQPPSVSTSTSLPNIGGLGGGATSAIVGKISDVFIYSDKLDGATMGALTTALEAEYA